jgi:hypothetical protein
VETSNSAAVQRHRSIVLLSSARTPQVMVFSLVTAAKQWLEDNNLSAAQDWTAIEGGEEDEDEDEDEDPACATPPLCSDHPFVLGACAVGSGAVPSSSGDLRSHVRRARQVRRSKGSKSQA